MAQEKSEQNIERLELRKKEKADLLHKKLEEKQVRQEAKEKGQDAKRLAKEHEEKLRLERLELRKKEKADLLHKTRKEKQARQEAKEREREAERRAKAELKSKQRKLALKELESRAKEKEEQKLKELEQKKEKKRLSELDSLGTAKETGLIDERKKAEEQKQKNDVVRIAAEVKEQRKLKGFKRKMEKEQDKREKEERKLKVIEEKKARKKMDLHLEEEVVKEKLSGHVERIDIFVGFDSIDQETADLLLKSGYTSVEKLREASVKDLMKIGLKKKTAQVILAESGEFIEWEVYDADEHPEKI